MINSLSEFTSEFMTGKKVTDIAIAPTTGDTPSEFIRVTMGAHTVIIDPNFFTDHVSLDVWAFDGDASVCTGVFGFSDDGTTVQMQENAPAKSHGWRGVRQAILVIGDQS